jgi:hypothetical protein
MNVVNVYIPPYVSLNKKGIKDKEATSSMEQVMENI